MKRAVLPAVAATLALVAAPDAVRAQQTQGIQPFIVGNPVGMPVTPGTSGVFEPVSSNVKVYGAIYSAESCSYDTQRGVIVVPNRVVPQNVQANDAFVSFINSYFKHTDQWCNENTHYSCNGRHECGPYNGRDTSGPYR